MAGGELREGGGLATLVSLLAHAATTIVQASLLVIGNLAVEQSHPGAGRTRLASREQRPP